MASVSATSKQESFTSLHGVVVAVVLTCPHPREWSYLKMRWSAFGGVITLRSPATSSCRSMYSAGQRATEGAVIQGHSGTQVIRFSAEPGKALLAGALLRLQHLLAQQVCLEAAIHSSQPGGAWSCCQTRKLAMVQLPALRDRIRRKSRDRIGTDGVPAWQPVARGSAVQAMRTIVPSHSSRKKRGLDGALRFHGIMKHEQFEWATCHFH